jgi:hypothetical protein
VRNLLGRLRTGLEPKRVFYDAQKVRVRVLNLVEAFERWAGARPGAKPQVEVRGMLALERTIRIAARRIAFAFTGGSALVACAATAAATRIEEWVPITLGSMGGALIGLLLLDLARER